MNLKEPWFIGSLYAGMSVAKADINESNEAIKYYNKAIELDPGRADYYLEAAKLYDGKGMLENDTRSLKLAIENYEKFINIRDEFIRQIMKDRNLDAGQISAPGMEYARKRIKSIREDLFFRGELEK